jgi:sn-glycerol 3-phosphate transport system permease protein
MEKRAVFHSVWLPLALVTPQLIITFVFFVWPASQALYQSVLLEDAFGLKSEFVWFDNFTHLFRNRDYLDSFSRTAVFSGLVAGLAMGLALLLAVMADRVIKGATGYKTMLIWPYAVAPAVAGALWVFMFNPRIGIVAYMLQSFGYDWNHQIRGEDAFALITVAAVWKQISYNFVFFLAGLQAIPKSLIEAAAIDGAGSFRTLWKVLLPGGRPAVLTLTVLVFMWSWNEFLLPLIMLSSDDLRTAPLGLPYFSTRYSTDRVGLAAAAVMVALPIVVVFVALQRSFVRGMTAGAVKE